MRKNSGWDDFKNNGYNEIVVEENEEKCGTRRLI